MQAGIKLITVLVFPLCGGLLAACAGIGWEDSSFTHGGKVSGNLAALARCTVDKLQSDSRWMIRSLQYQVFSYPDIAAMEIYAYPEGALAGTYARNSPSNPDAACLPPSSIPADPAAMLTRKWIAIILSFLP